MAKATTKAATAKAAPAQSEAPAPRLVGDEAKTETVAVFTAPPPAENVLAAGEDGGRLTYLEGRLNDLTHATMGFDGYHQLDGEDIFDFVIRVVTNQAETIASLLASAKDAAAAVSGHVQLGKLFAFVLARPDFVDKGENAADAAIRIIGEMDADLADAKGAITALDEGIKNRDDFRFVKGDSPAGSVVASALELVSDLDHHGAQMQETIGELTADPAAAAAKEARRAHAKAEKGEVAVLADLPDSAALTLRFAEDGDRFIATIPPRAIERSQLSAFGERGVLEVAIDFPPDTPPAHIRSVWLIAGPKSVKCEMHPGVRVGGGATVQIPKGHLVF